MAINISSEVGTIKVEITSFYYSGKAILSPSVIYFNKAEVDISSASNYVFLKDYNSSISILYSDITTPSGASADAIANIIQGYIGGLGSGTVFSVSSGNLSPLFSVLVTNPTTTPAISFTAVSQAANLVYASPATGAAAAPTFRALVASDIPSLPITKIIPLSIGISEDFSHLFSDVISVGLITNNPNLIQDNGGETIIINAGEGLVRVSDNPEAIIYYIAWDAAVIAIPTGATRYVYFRYNGGVPDITLYTSEQSNEQTQSYLGEVHNIAGVLDIHNDPIRGGDFNKRMTEQWSQGIGTFVKSGETVTDAAAPSRKIAVEAGFVFKGHISSTTTPYFNSNTGGTFTNVYRNGAGDWVRTAGQTEWDNDNIDTGTGSLTPMTPSFYACRYIIRSLNGFIYSQYGFAEYATEALARAEGEPSTRPEEVTEHGYYIAKIVFQKGASTLSGAIESLKPLIGGTVQVGGSSVHNDLSGKQGGTGGEYYHATASEYTVLQNTSGTNTGDNAVNTLYGNWLTVQGTPVRTGNYTFTITDTANANLYDLLYSRKTVLKWTDTGVTKLAMIHSAIYATNTVTVTVIGDIITATAIMNTLKYANQKADEKTFISAGNIGIGNDITGHLYYSCPTKPFGVDGYHKTAGVTNATTYQVSKNVMDGTATQLAAALSIASASLVTQGQTFSDGATLASGDYLALNCVSVSTTPPLDIYVTVFSFPYNSIYLT